MGNLAFLVLLLFPLPARSVDNPELKREGPQAPSRTAAEIAAAASRQARVPGPRIQRSAALSRQAASALAERDFSAGLILATQAIDLNGANAQAWNFRAIANAKLGRLGQAVYDASFVLGLVPGNPAALQTRSWALSRQGRFQEALADASLSLQAEPDNAYAHHARAVALAGLGDREGAREALRRSAGLDPRFQAAYEQALRGPRNLDLLFLLKDGLALPPAPRSSFPFLRLVLYSLSGAILVALGLLHVLSAAWRQRLRTTVRRVLGGDGSSRSEARRSRLG